MLPSFTFRRLYGLEPVSCVEFNSYDDRNYFMVVDKEHTNPNIQQLNSPGYVLKVFYFIDETGIIRAGSFRNIIPNVHYIDAFFLVLAGTFKPLLNLITHQNNVQIIMYLKVRQLQLKRYEIIKVNREGIRV